MCYKFIVICYFVILNAASNVSDTCTADDVQISTGFFSQHCVPVLNRNNVNGQSGKIAIIGGSTYEASLYFTTMSSLKAGADFVEVFTTDSSVPIIKSYNPDVFTVWPYLQYNFLPKLMKKIINMDLIVIGVGITRSEEEEMYSMISDIIQTCKDLKKPLVLDAGALHAVTKNLSIIQNYPSPGVILTPNSREADALEKKVRAESNITNWYKYWGDYVSVLVKGKEDKFYCSVPLFEWRKSTGGSPRRGIGQGDILAGILGTFYNWGIQSGTCANQNSVQYVQSLATYAATTLTRKCNEQAFSKIGRSMLASDMVKEIHTAFVATLNLQ